MKSLKDIFQITKKDLLEFVRDRIRLITFAIMPIFMMVLVGFIFPSQNTLKNIPIGLTNNDNGEISNKLANVASNLEVTSGNKAFKITNYKNVDEIKEGIRKQEISGGLVILAGFSQDLEANKQATVVIVQDQSNPQISAITSQTLTQIIEGFGQQLGVQKVDKLLVSKISVPSKEPANQGLAFVAPIKPRLEGLVSGDGNYFEFVAPGIMAMVVMTAVLTGLAASVSREKEQGTLDGILIAPISRLSIILGKTLSQSIRGLIQGMAVLLLAIFLFGVKIHGSILLVALLLLLGIFSFVGLGILVSASAAEQETATQLLFMFQFPMLFLSGAFFPLQQMPELMQRIAHILPLTYAIEALRKVVILGAGIQEVQKEIFILTAIGIVTLSFAVPMFRRMITR